MFSNTFHSYFLQKYASISGYAYRLQTNLNKPINQHAITRVNANR
ncbi:hypothetical protein SAMN04488491_2378 [Psychrobacter sp. LV10R520-6]|nr:hypothetical protein SAMN04488491_2378 [Psychrobacter sp. LV10R520-6]